ncbi:enterotoxin A family protein [Xenorhabdus taiwanensis]|uniref:Pertussis toxin ADP-ribosyltransferase subunit S1 n=1 Tax=Xenorhabdus taiwanensis TaxID=3085177 RepID=A0ABM8JVD8_9GAMM|nr:pertussis toxin ADP-ribosyltransferase subunit S1 [Xenorhabdus sp. TCT-1]
MRILKLLYLLLCVVFLYTAQSYAQPPVYTVYRMDYRSLEEIIAAGGFRPLGTNDDVARHVQGIEPQNPLDPAENSAFVATSTDRAFAYDWGSAFLDEQHDPFYLYDIRPTSNFYSVVLTLEHLYQQTNNERYRDLIRNFGYQQEYVAARGGIDITQIRGAQRFEYVRNTNDYVRSGGYINNPYYQQADTLPNTGPYIQRSQSPNEIITPVSYCAINLSLPRYSIRLTASTQDKYPFLKKLKTCHDSLSTIAFLNAVFL